jgi:hypothetical protein
MAEKIKTVETGNLGLIVIFQDKIPKKKGFQLPFPMGLLGFTSNFAPIQI